MNCVCLNTTVSVARRLDTLDIVLTLAAKISVSGNSAGS